jgi:hypothetical protein
MTLGQLQAMDTNFFKSELWQILPFLRGYSQSTVNAPSNQSSSSHQQQPKTQNITKQVLPTFFTSNLLRHHFPHQLRKTIYGIQT